MVRTYSLVDSSGRLLVAVEYSDGVEWSICFPDGHSIRYRSKGMTLERFKSLFGVPRDSEPSKAGGAAR